jgi:hypothetical protein
MLADGDVRITDTYMQGWTAFLHAAMGGNRALPTLKWLLEEGGALITERSLGGNSALLHAAVYGNIATCQWLLEHGGADIADAHVYGTANGEKLFWDHIPSFTLSVNNAAEVTALLRVMVLKGDPPANVVSQLRPEHVRVVEEGARLRAALPANLEQRRALLDAHCPLIPPLLALVRDYDPKPTTTEELWSTGLGATRNAPGAPVSRLVSHFLCAAPPACASA